MRNTGEQKAFVLGTDKDVGGAIRETDRTAFDSPVKKDKTQASKSHAVRPVADTPQIAS